MQQRQIQNLAGSRVSPRVKAGLLCQQIQRIHDPPDASRRVSGQQVSRGVLVCVVSEPVRSAAAPECASDRIAAASLKGDKQ